MDTKRSKGAHFLICCDVPMTHLMSSCKNLNGDQLPLCKKAVKCFPCNCMAPSNYDLRQLVFV